MDRFEREHIERMFPASEMVGCGSDGYRSMAAQWADRLAVSRGVADPWTERALARHFQVTYRDQGVSDRYVIDELHQGLEARLGLMRAETDEPEEALRNDALAEAAARIVAWEAFLIDAKPAPMPHGRGFDRNEAMRNDVLARAEALSTPCLRRA